MKSALDLVSSHRSSFVDASAPEAEQDAVRVFAMGGNYFFLAVLDVIKDEVLRNAVLTLICGFCAAAFMIPSEFIRATVLGKTSGYYSICNRQTSTLA